MTTKQKNRAISNRFKLITESSLKKDCIELTRWQSAELRRNLPKGIYWIQITPGGLIHWNWELLQSYLLVGANDPSHRALVEEYISTLTTAA